MYSFMYIYIYPYIIYTKAFNMQCHVGNVWCWLVPLSSTIYIFCWTVAICTACAFQARKKSYKDSAVALFQDNFSALNFPYFTYFERCSLFYMFYLSPCISSFPVLLKFQSLHFIWDWASLGYEWKAYVPCVFRWNDQVGRAQQAECRQKLIRVSSIF